MQGMVADIDKLDRYPFSGRGIIMGKKKPDWQNTAHEFNLFVSL